MREAVAREVHEECGIEIEVGQVVGILDNILRDRDGTVRYHYAIVDFAARYICGELDLNDELIDAAWITPDQFDAYDVPVKSREVLIEALRTTQRVAPPSSQLGCGS